MTSTLRVLLAERWPEPAAVHWVVLEDDGKVVNSGHGEPRTWPATDRIEAVLHGPQTSWLKVRVPKAGVREQALALGFALEEQLIREADSQHTTPTLRETESWHVIVVARERLKRLVTQFEVISRPLDAVYSILQTLPCEADAWALSVDEHGVIIRTGAHVGWIEDLPPSDEPPYLLQLAITEAREATALPSRILALGNTEKLPLAHWSEQLGISIEPGGSWAWYKNDGPADDLLHGEFIPRHRRKVWQRALRPALIALGLVMAIHLLLGTGYAWWRRAEMSQIRSNMEKLMRSQLPNDPILDPAAQIKRELNLQRSQHGRLADDAALALMADFAAAMGPDSTGAIQSLRYQEGSLDLGLVRDKSDLSSIRARLEARGLSITPREGDGRFVIRRAN